jgi:hypothetical protein
LFRVHRSTSQPSSSVVGIIPPSSARLSSVPLPPSLSSPTSEHPLSVRVTTIPTLYSIFLPCFRSGGVGKDLPFPVHMYPRSCTSTAPTPSRCLSPVAYASLQPRRTMLPRGAKQVGQASVEGAAGPSSLRLAGA